MTKVTDLTKYRKKHKPLEISNSYPSVTITDINMSHDISNGFVASAEKKLCKAISFLADAAGDLEMCGIDAVEQTEMILNEIRNMAERAGFDPKKFR